MNLEEEIPDSNNIIEPVCTSIFFPISMDRTKGFNFPQSREMFQIFDLTFSSDRYEYSPKNIRMVRDGKIMLTAEEASKYILSFTYFEIPVVNFIKVCYQASRSLPASEEKVLVNLVLVKLKDKIALDVQAKELTKMTELVKLIKLALFPPINISDCRKQIQRIRLEEYEDIFDYVARFQQLHTIILDYEITTKPDSNLDNIIKRVEHEHLLYFCRGTRNFMNYKCSLIFPIIFKDLNFNIVELVTIMNLINVPTKQKVLLKNEQEPELNKMLKFSLEAPFSNVIPGFVIDQHNTFSIGLIRVKEASKIIPYFDGTNLSIYNFIERCYIALSNIALEEEQELIGIIISRLKGEAAESVKWFIITNMVDLILLLSSKFRYVVARNAIRMMSDIYMQPEENMHDYIIRFKKLHVIILNMKIYLNLTQPLKKIINIVQTNNLVEFINGYAPTSFTPAFMYEGFHDFLEKIGDEYDIFDKKRKNKGYVQKLLFCTNCCQQDHMKDHCKILNRIKNYNNDHTNIKNEYLWDL